MPFFNFTDIAAQIFHHLCYLPINVVAQRDATGQTSSRYPCETTPSLVDHIPPSVSSTLVIESFIRPSSTLDIHDEFWIDPERSPSCGIVKLEEDICIAVVESATDLETLDYPCSGALVRAEQRLLVWETNGRTAHDMPSLCAFVYERLSDKLGAFEESQHNIPDPYLDLNYEFNESEMLSFNSSCDPLVDPWISSPDPLMDAMWTPFDSHSFWPASNDSDLPILFTTSKKETWRRPLPVAGSPISSPESSPATSSNSSLPGSPSTSHSPFPGSPLAAALQEFSLPSPENSPSPSHPILFADSYASHALPHAPDVPFAVSPKDIFPELADAPPFATNVTSISIFGSASYDADDEHDDAQACAQDTDMTVAAAIDAQYEFDGMDTSDDELSDTPSTFSRESSPEVPLSAAPRHTSHQPRAPSLDVDPSTVLAWQTAAHQSRVKARDVASSGTPSSSAPRLASRVPSSSRTSHTSSLSPAPSTTSTSGSSRKRKHSEPAVPEADEREDEHADDEDDGASESDGDDDAYDPPSEPDDGGDGEYFGGRTKKQKQKRPAKARPTKPLPKRARGTAPAARAPRKAAASGEGSCVCTWSGCSQLFGRRHDMLRHVVAVHEKKDLQCEGCGKKYCRTDSLQRHLGGECPLLSPAENERALAELEEKKKAERRAKKSTPTEKPRNGRRSKRSCE